MAGSPPGTARIIRLLGLPRSAQPVGRLARGERMDFEQNAFGRAQTRSWCDAVCEIGAPLGFP
jgi:hypothetical protein